MPKPNKPDQTETSAEPVSTGQSASATAQSQAPKKAKPRYVRVENKLRQVISLSVVNDDGQAAELKLGPLATSEPLREDCLTDQIRRFASDGKVRIR